jgi:P4 family phage/plasmid primase-like protien
MHNQWKKENKFAEGIAVMAGKGWFNDSTNDLYLNEIDLDNELAVKEICTKPDGSKMSIEDLARWTLVEQHLDDRTRLHLYVLSEKPFPRIKLTDKPVAIEIKSTGHDGFHYCTNSRHCNGQRYQIIGTYEPVLSDVFIEHIEKVLTKYGTKYPESESIYDLFAPHKKIYKGNNRHLGLLRTMDSLIARNQNILPLDKIKQISRERNNELCQPPLDEREFEKLWKQSTEFIGGNGIAEGQHKEADIIIKIAERIMQESVFKTCTDNGELYYYNGKIYIPGQEWRIKQTAQLIDPRLRSHQKQEIINWIKDSTYIDRSEFDANPDIIPVDNGLLNIHTRKLEPFTSRHLSLIKLPMPYDPDAKCPNIKKFLGEVLESDAEEEMMIKLIGNCLLTSCEYETAVMLYGGGRNGKGTLLKLIEAFLGNVNYSNRSLQELDKNRFAVADLFSKLANVFADLKSLRLSETGYFKMIVSGDSLSGEKKFKDAFGFRNRAKLWFSVNEIPESDDKSDAFYRRWKIFHFDREFDKGNRDTQLIKKLTTPEELSGSLNLALDGLAKLIEEGGFEQDIEAIRKDYERHTNDVNAFLYEECTVDTTNPRYSTLASELYGAYVRFCMKRNTRPKDMTPFGKKLADKGIYNNRRMEDDSREHYYDGVMLGIPESSWKNEPL